MAESTVATSHQHQEAPSAARTPAAPDAAAPEAALDAEGQALVRALHTAGGAAAAGTAGGSGPPSTPTWTRSPRVGGQHLLALQRSAGNRAVTGLVGRRPATASSPRPTVQRDDTKPAPGGASPSLADPEATPAGPVGKALEIEAGGLHEGVKKLAKGLTTLKGEVVVIGLQPTFLYVYNRAGQPISPRIPIELKKGMHFSAGVFVITPDGGQTQRLRINATTGRVQLAEVAGVLIEKPPKAAPAPGTATATSTAKPDAGAAGAGTTGAGGPGGAATGGNVPATDGPSSFDLRDYIKDETALNKALEGLPMNAWQFFLVPTISGGSSSGKPGGARSSGFAGELEGKGTPPNRPAWPVSMEGPKTLPVGGQGTFAASINWAAHGSNTLDMVTAQLGNDIFYRWELFDITAQAKREADKEAARARQAKAAIEALMRTAAAGPEGGAPAGATGGGQPATGPDAAGTGAGAAGGGGGGKPMTGAGAVKPPKPKAVGSPEDKSLADEILERQGAKVGSGTNMNGATAGADFERDFAHLWGDTKRTWAAVGESKAETWAEKRSDDIANLTAATLLPVSALITLLGASFRYGADKLAGERMQQDIPMPNKGTYLVRVIATPRIMTSSSGEQIIRPSAVAVQTVEVVDMESMVASALRDPGTKKKELENALATAEKALKAGSGDQKTVDALKTQLDNLTLELEGDPIKLLDKKIVEKDRELTAAKAKWEKLNIRGPIIDLENQLDTLKQRRKLFQLQEDRRVAALKAEGLPIIPATRVNATLVSELTGQTYPLLISLGQMGMTGTKHRWKVLDATSKKAEGFEGVGDTADEAIDNAFRAFAADAQYGRGIIGLQLPTSIMGQLEKGAKSDRRYTSAPAGWAVARGRIDDLVMTLAAIGLFVATAGTAAAILGGVVAAAKLVHRLHAGTLEMDVELVSDVLAIFGAAGAIAQGAAKGSQAAAKAAQAEAKAGALKVGGLRVQPVGELFVITPEVAAAEANFAKASAALARAGALAKRVEWANEALGYAGLVWGNATFLITMADISAQEASGAISHSEARRQRANAIGGAIQNNGMFIAGNAIKAKQAKKAQAAAAAAAKARTEPSAGGTTAGPEPTTTKPAGGGPEGEGAGGASGRREPAPETQVPKESVGPREPAPTDAPPPTERPTKGAGADDATGTRKPPEPNVPEGGPGTGPKPTEATGGTPKPAVPEGPVPGSKKARAAAQSALEGVATGEKRTTTVEDAIKLAANWKEALKGAVSKLQGEERVTAEKALVEAREKIVNETWDQVKAAANGKYDGLRLENAGTRSFGSDIDATVRPKEGAEAQGTGQQMADQVKLAAEAAQAMSEALRKRIGGGETDVVIDTNIYSFIGEGRIKPADAKSRAAQQQVDIVVGLAEQLRGQNELQFKAFEQRLAGKLGDPRVAAEAKALLAKAREFHDARAREWSTALADAQAANPKGGEAAQKRAARERLLGDKKRELAGLMSAEPPNYEAIAAKQSEINWFAPDAYATPSAFRQAVAHGQRLKGTGRSALEYKGPEIAAKLREAAAKLPADNPKAAKLKADAERVERQQRLLDMTLNEMKQLQAEAPMDAARVDELQRRAEQLREAIAAPMEKILVAEIMSETAAPSPSDKPSAKQLSESAAASGANMGMLEDHVRHAPDLDGKVKAAAKYGARIAMAEWLSGLRPAGDAIGLILGEFVKSRWDIAGDIAPDVIRDMFLKYAMLTGQGKGIVHDTTGRAVGVTDQVKQAFVDDVRSWSRGTNEGIQAAAIGSKAMTNPMEPMPSPGGQAPAGAGPAPAGGDATPAQAPKPADPKPAGTAPTERPTVVPAAPESQGPATRREGAGPGPAKPATAEGGGGRLEDIPGGVKVDIDDNAITVRARQDPNALVRIQPMGNTLRLTDLYRRSLPAGSGVLLLTEALKRSQAVRGNEILIHNILNPETVAAHKDGQDPALSKLGVTIQRALEGAGLKAGPMRWEFVDGKLCISLEIQ